MDYAIYKTHNGENIHIVHTFTQKRCNHKAKAAARVKLDEMWRRICCSPNLFKNAKGTDDDFEYDYMTSANTTDHIRFFIGKLEHKKQS
jgi:hypothetical protein